MREKPSAPAKEFELEWRSDATLPSLQLWIDNIFLPTAPATYDIYKNSVLQLKTAEADETGRRGYRFAIQNSTKLVAGANLLRSFTANLGNVLSPSDYWMLYMLQQLAGQGIKVFRPSVTECEALENCEPRLPCSEYEQPFEIYVIELPKDYANKRTVQGVSLIDGLMSDHMPIAVVAMHIKEIDALAVIILLHNGQGLRHICDFSNKDAIIADEINYIEEAADRHAITPEESKLARYSINLVVNTSLLLTHYGCKRIGSTNPEKEKKLLGYLKKKENHHTERNRTELRALPVLYGFEQHVKIYDEVKAQHKEDSDNSGVTLRPHWRRGHWAMLACGPGMKDRKKHFRKACLVNPHLFGGPEYNTRVSMTTS